MKIAYRVRILVFIKVNKIIRKVSRKIGFYNRLRNLLLQYTVVGGMPAVVETFVNMNQMNTVLSMQRDIIRSYDDNKNYNMYINEKEDYILKNK